MAGGFCAGGGTVDGSIEGFMRSPGVGRFGAGDSVGTDSGVGRFGAEDSAGTDSGVGAGAATETFFTWAE